MAILELNVGLLQAQQVNGLAIILGGLMSRSGTGGKVQVGKGVLGLGPASAGKAGSVGVKSSKGSNVGATATTTTPAATDGNNAIQSVKK